MTLQSAGTVNTLDLLIFFVVWDARKIISLPCIVFSSARCVARASATAPVVMAFFATVCAGVAR
eukprot:1836011-Lingulodinium_polyedra.AAC.1